MWPSWVLLIIFGLIVAWVLRSDLHEVNCPPDSCKFDKCKSGNGAINYLGRGSDDESIEVLLSRIDWVADAEQRNPKWKRSLTIAYIVLLLLIIVVYQKTPKPEVIVMTLIIVFVVTLAFFGYYNFHSVKYSNHYIHQNIDRIRSKLGLSSVELHENSSSDLPHPSEINMRRIS